MTRTLVATPDPEPPRNERRWPVNTTTTAVTNGWVQINQQR